jgi:hypothetical protein
MYGQLEKRWANRFKGGPHDRDQHPLFVLKSSFNPVWEEFPLQELQDTVNQAWKQAASDLDAHQWMGNVNLDKVPGEAESVFDTDFLTRHWLVSRCSAPKMVDWAFAW